MTGEEDDRIEGENADTWTGDEGEPLETERLDLDEEGERLPWLESADDDYPEEAAGGGLGRLIGLGAVALVAIVGGVWWASHRAPGGDAVADGSVIAAPKEPYKEAPKNPGGKTFDGTGDTSFAVSEGQTRPAKMGDAGAAAVSTPAPPAPKPGAAPTAAPAPAPASGGVGVQVGAYSSKAAAEAGWAKLVGQAGGALSGVSHRVIEGTADIGKVYRLQAVAGDAGAANALCGRLKGAGISCQVK